MPSDTDLAAKLDALIARVESDTTARVRLKQMAPLLAAVARDAAALGGAQEIVFEGARYRLVIPEASDALDASLAALAKEIDNG
jgi:hypothetical protein